MRMGSILNLMEFFHATITTGLLIKKTFTDFKHIYPEFIYFFKAALKQCLLLKTLYK